MGEPCRGTIGYHPRYPGEFIFAGGAVDAGESLEQAARRAAGLVYIVDLLNNVCFVGRSRCRVALPLAHSTPAISIFGAALTEAGLHRTPALHHRPPTLHQLLAACVPEMAVRPSRHGSLKGWADDIVLICGEVALLVQQAC